MFNLLPENIKDQIRVDYRVRKYIVVLICFIFLEIALLVSFAPAWTLSYYNEKEVKDRFEDLSQSSATLNVNSVSATIRAINIRLKVIDSTLEYQEVVPLVDSILSKKSKSITIIGIKYIGTSKSGANVSIQGVSSTRESLVVFVKDLQSLGIFNTVDLPVSNLAKDKDIAFTLNLVTNTVK